MSNTNTSAIVKVINVLQEHGWNENKIMYYLKLNPTTLRNLKTGLVKTYKLENTIELVKNLKNENENDLALKIIEKLFNDQV